MLLCSFHAAGAGSVARNVDGPPRAQVQALKVTILSTMLADDGIGEWGFAALVEADGHRILVDTGARPQTVLQNTREVGVDLSNVNEVVLTHNHQDHTGGLVTLRTELMKTSPTALSEIRVQKIKGYIQWRRREGDADSTIRRQLGHLRLAFNRALKDELINRNDVPPFELPKDSKPRSGFLDVSGFKTLRDALPMNLRDTVTFLYYTGCRTGAAEQITWRMVSQDCTEIELDAAIMKNDEPVTIPLVGPLEEISTMLKAKRKHFPKPNDLVLDFNGLRYWWNMTCHKLGLGVFDKKLRHYSGLSPHDFRRSAARNLIKAGVSRQIVMMITGHKTEHIFERYNIKTTDDVKEALIKVGAMKSHVVAIDERG